MTRRRVPLSFLDLAPVAGGSTVSQALADSLAHAVAADRAGFQRYWYAEHHNTKTIASSATSLLIGRAAEHTVGIRVGSGGVMLPNHSPLMVAEYYGTLAELYGDRIDLGLGRAPGTDPLTARALRRGVGGADTFLHDVVDLHRYLADVLPDGHGTVNAYPGRGTAVPLWILGSSLDGAQFAAALGLPYAFASHFAPDLRHEAIALYRERFSTDFETATAAPYVMGAVNVLVAPTDDEAAFLLSSAQQMFASIRTGNRSPIQPPVADVASVVGPEVLAAADHMLAVKAVGSPESVVAQLEAIVADLGLDEVIVTTTTYDPRLRIRSTELLAEAWGLTPRA